MFVNVPTFSHWLNTNWESGNLCAPELEHDLALEFIESYLVAPYIPYFTGMGNGKQLNVDLVDFILRKYSPMYRVEVGCGSLWDKIVTWWIKHFSHYNR